MDVAASRFPIVECPARGCSTPVVWASERGIHHPFEVQPANDGVFQLRDVGNDLPMAIRLVTGQRFGKQGQLHNKHDCPRMRAARRR